MEAGRVGVEPGYGVAFPFHFDIQHSVFVILRFTSFPTANMA